jgi:hypothetical protein
MAKKVLATEKRQVPLSEFVEGVNKKDEVSGLKIHFAFCNRKRKGG